MSIKKKGDHSLIQFISKNKKLYATIIIILVMLFSQFDIAMAINITDENCLTPEDNQYLELRAVEVKEVEGQNKQVIMELWGNNVEFKRI